MSNLKSVVNLVGEHLPLQKKQMEKMLEILTEEEIERAERTLAFFTDKMKHSINEIADAYRWFIIAIMEEQIEFIRTGKYAHSTFAEVENFYNDKKLMKNYMLSLATSLYLFPQHIKVLRFYKEFIISLAVRTERTRYLEIGPGHGHLFITAMENSNFDSYTAVDISQTSVDMTTSYKNYCLPDKSNWQIINKNIFSYNSNDKFDIIVMGEVLEHVEKPMDFLRKVHELSQDDAAVFVSTAINAPFFDHIYHFKTVEELEKMFLSCGFNIIDKVYGTANNVDFDVAVKKKHAIVPAYILEKARD